MGAGATVSVLPVPGASAVESRRPLRIRHGHIQVLGRDMPTSLMTLAVLEVLVFVTAFIVAAHIVFPGGATSAPAFFEAFSIKVIAFAGLNMLAMLSMGLYRRGMRVSLGQVVVRLVGAFALGGVMLAVLFYVFPHLFLGRGVMLVAVSLAFAGVLTTRLVGVRLLHLDAFKRRVLVLGSGSTASLFSRLRRRSDRVGFDLTGFVPQKNETPQVDPERIVEPAGSLAQYACDRHIDDVVIALDDPRGGFPVDELMACKMAGVHVLDVSDFFEREGGFLKLDILRPSTMIFSRGFRQSIYSDYLKRIMDLATGVGMLAVVWPIMLLTALGILIESRGRGSILFRQTRVGQNGRPFTLYKFRSMIEDAEADGVARWAEKKDPRVTRFGSFMRTTRLDELPQLFNVLRGDMSFVGPRPERPEFVEQLASRLPYYHHRHWVKPGLTGWAQINYPYGASEKDAFEKLQYDLYYVKNQSISLDLLTIIQTVEVVLWGRGSR
ncbi:TIGR03013 family XrtA/PEP-CTERM system glycosyltransferase [Thioalkalivibrio denitrificans]|nr:TIGR03013 family XrtA/PEP-CTERM system glycosyltransferase [Thioalkalivibrio denitrificans]